MRRRDNESLPLARTEKLIVKEMADEVLVYDLDRAKAHCLNKASAIVWRHCDGKLSVRQMTSVLEERLGTAVDDDVVWLALSQLKKFHLLKESANPLNLMKVSRRDLVTKYIPVALALPLILSVATPTAAQAGGSCVPPGGGCTTNAQCCGPGGVPGAGFCVGAGVCQTTPP